MSKVSIIIPVLDEADGINDLIDHVRGLRGAASREIIVVDGSAGGDTLRALTHGDVHRLASPRGRARQMNAGAAVAEGEILIFLHADTHLPPDALPMIEAVMEQPEFVGGAFDLGIMSERWMFKIIASVASFRSRLSRIPYGDQAIFMRRTYFNHLGGYPDIPLMEDVALMRAIKKAGGRIRIIPRHVSTSPRRWEKEGIFFVTMRNWAILSLYHLGVSPATLAKYYRSGEDGYRVQRTMSREKSIETVEKVGKGGNHARE